MTAILRKYKLNIMNISTNIQEAIMIISCMLYQLMIHVLIKSYGYLKIIKQLFIN